MQFYLPLAVVLVIVLITFDIFKIYHPHYIKSDVREYLTMLTMAIIPYLQIITLIYILIRVYDYFIKRHNHAY